MGSLSQGIKGRKNIVWIFTFFFFLKISNGIQKYRSRQLSDGNQFKTVICSIQSPGRIKRSFVLCYKPLSRLCVNDTSRGQLGHEDGWWGWGWEWAPWNGPVRSAGLGSPCSAGAWISPTQASPTPLGPLTPFPGGFQGPHPMTSFWVNLNPKCHHHCRAQRIHPKLQLSITEGISLGGWAVLPCKPQLGIWFQKWTTPGSENDLMIVRVWAPGLTLLSHCFFCLGITSERLEVCPCLWGSGCLNRYQPLKKEKIVKEEENRHVFFSLKSVFISFSENINFPALDIKTKQEKPPEFKF